MKKLADMQVLQIFRNISPYLRTICIYRYFSLLLISIFYLMNKERYLSVYGLVVAGFLAVAALTLNYLYIRYENMNRIIKLLIIIEIISNIIILIPTGGLESPYIWYSLNTVLFTAYFLNTRYFTFNLFAYTGFLAITSFYILPGTQTDIMNFFYGNSNLILSYILIIFAVQLLMNIAKKLDENGTKLTLVNKELIEANAMIKGSMVYIASLFQSLQGFLNIKDKSGFFTIITEYTKTITNTPMAFLYTYSKPGTSILEIREEVPKETKEHLKYSIEQNYECIISSDEPHRIVLDGRELAMAAIKSSRKVYGIIGIELNNNDGGIIEKENISQIKFLASLVSIILERFEIEEMNQLLLITDEQSRIANEIHDSVSQRLFYVSCKLHSLIKMSSKRDEAEMSYELELIRDCLNSAMTELRDTIYNYGRKSKVLSAFEENIRNYINEISRLNGVNILVDIIGNQEYICFDQKKIIYRIICEGIGNSIRHGKSKNINVDLSVEKDCIKLKISDDGTGFDLNGKLASNSVGLGIKNLYNLVDSSDGNISIESQLHKGTLINVVLPKKILMKAGREEPLCV